MTGLAAKQLQVIVLGMHRSGTSVTAMLLNELGVYFGSGLDFINANVENPRGFWERKDVRRLNDYVLHALDSEWDEVSLLDISKLSAADTAYFSSVASDILTQFGDQALIGIKEPRINVLLPLWQKVFTNAVYVHTWRDPREIALSLKERNGLTTETGQALTDAYLSLAHKHVADHACLGVDFHEIIASPFDVSKKIHAFLLKAGAEGLREPEEARIDQVVSEKLHRAHLGEKPNKLTARQCELRNTVLDPSTSRKHSLTPLDAQLLDQLKNHELQKRAGLRKEVMGLRSERDKQLTELTRLKSDRVMFQEKIQELFDKRNEQKSAITALYNTIEQDRLEYQRATDEYQRATDEYQRNIDEYQRTGEQDRLEYQKKITENRQEYQRTTTQDRLEYQRKAAVKEVELYKLQENIADYRMLNKLLYRFFQTKIWRICSAIVSLGAKTGVAPSAAQTLHDLIELRTRIALNDKDQVRPSNPQYTLEKGAPSELLGIAPIYSLIVLNRDGKAHLGELFDSLLRFENPSEFELIIVDHSSTDGSREFVRSRFDSLRIKMMCYQGNNSFSYGCNQGALHAESDTLVFLNNDIILDQVVLAEMHRVLKQSAAPCVSLPLYYPDESKNRSKQVQHAGIDFKPDTIHNFQRPYNVNTLHDSNGWRHWPAVTAAFLMCKRQVFNSVNGFDERYLYGYEDVDLCLSLAQKTSKLPVVANDIAAIHDESASQNKDHALAIKLRRQSNIAVLKSRFGKALDRYSALKGLDSLKTDADAEPFKVGLVVTDDKHDTTAGDFFTASEFAEALTSEFGWECVYLAQRSRNHDWYDASDLDCLIVMVDRYDLKKIRNRKPHLLTVAWVRNWFERWPTHDWFRNFDLVLSSSQHGAEYLRSATSRPCHVLRIATNEMRFHPDNNSSSEHQSDYCFTGSYWNVKREIEDFDPSSLPFDFALYGQGWEKHKQFSKHYRGFLNYAELPAVYAGTKLLVDDANHVTRPWASVNSRVFDGIAAGAMVISNGESGAKELFGDKLPTYDSVEQLESLIEKYLRNSELRVTHSEQLRSNVLANHTYRRRATEFRDILIDHAQTFSQIAIKIGVPSYAKAPEWGDYHFAKALQKELLRIGHRCRVDILPEWYGKHTLNDEVVLVLRGLSQYQPSNDQLNLLWMISHPDKVTPEELNQYNHIFVSSLPYTDVLAEVTTTSCSTLLQCTDHDLFYPSSGDDSDGDTDEVDRILFVGNSRLQYRKIVKDSIEANIEIEVYGSRWESLIPERFIIGTHLENSSLRQHYSSAKVLLNDHWESMLDNGFISNRLFDAAACGATVVSDHIDGLEEIFLNTLYSYDGSADGLKSTIELAIEEKHAKTDARLTLAKHIRDKHSFRARAQEIHTLIHSRSLAGILALGQSQKDCVLDTLNEQ
ncbi:MAG: glycosyltransferase [Pseudomonadales bacterium]